ncbi:hypothetical protein E2C01_095665 [Portunus trituberculatus]|uniref:Uncharacterized protein n=1 Tax=Portunus trituberculatus TaxID=210409 RepID=A0A5B7K0X9_PORTR|nr:hypothetical protein [Portunus trituberculatus]
MDSVQVLTEASVGRYTWAFPWPLILGAEGWGGTRYRSKVQVAPFTSGSPSTGRLGPGQYTIVQRWYRWLPPTGPWVSPPAGVSVGSGKSATPLADPAGRRGRGSSGLTSAGRRQGSRKAEADPSLIRNS